MAAYCCWILYHSTVLLLKSFHIRRSLFLITGSHHILHEFRDHYSLFHQLPITIFLLNSQKRGQMRQSNHPPLFGRRRSATYWAEIWLANQGSNSPGFVSQFVLYFSLISSEYFHGHWQYLRGLTNVMVIMTVIHDHIHHHSDHHHCHHHRHHHRQKLHCNVTSISLENLHICLFQFFTFFSIYLHHHHHHNKLLVSMPQACSG